MKIKNVFKRVTAFTLSMMMMVSLCACGSGDAATSASESDVATEAAVDNSGMTTVSVYRPCFFGQDDAATEAVQNAINEYIGPKANIQIQLTGVDNTDYPTKLNLELASGAGVDVFFTASWALTVGCKDLIRNNAVLDITDMLADYPALKESVPEVFWESAQYNSRDYFVPIYKDIVAGYDIYCAPETAEALDCDLSTIETLEDLEPYLAKAKAAGYKYPMLFENESRFCQFAIDDYNFLEDWAGISKNDDGTKIVNLVESEEFKNYCTLMHSWADAGYINEEEATKSVPVNAFSEKEFAFSVINTGLPASYATALGWEPITKSLTQGWINTGASTGGCYAINVNTANPEASMKFLELLMTDTTVADLFTYGIKDVDYTLNADGKVEANPDTTYKNLPLLSTSVKALTPAADQDDNYIADLESFNDSGKAVPGMGFQFDSSTVSAEYAAVTNVSLEYAYQLELGFMDPETDLAKYQESLKEAGIDKVIAEMQRQYDEWMATQK